MIYLISALCLVGGFFIGYFAYRALTSKKVGHSKEIADKIINEAKSKEKETLLKAQDKALAIINEAKTEEGNRRKEISNQQKAPTRARRIGAKGDLGLLLDDVEQLHLEDEGRIGLDVAPRAALTVGEIARDVEFPL